MEDKQITLDILYANKFCQYVKNHNRFFDIVFNDLIAQIRKSGGDDNLIAARNCGHIFYDKEPLYDYDLVTMCLYGIRYSEFAKYFACWDKEDIRDYLKNLRKEALEAISVVELEYYTMHEKTYTARFFYYMRPNQSEYSMEDIDELASYGIRTTDRIKEVV